MNQNIATKIKDLRLSKGWTQSECAEKLKITAAALCLIENSLRIPSSKTLIKIASLYNTTIDALLNASSDDDAAVVAHARALESLNPAARELIYKQIEWMRNKEHDWFKSS